MNCCLPLFNDSSHFSMISSFFLKNAFCHDFSTGSWVSEMSIKCSRILISWQHLAGNIVAKHMFYAILFYHLIVSISQYICSKFTIISALVRIDNKNAFEREIKTPKMICLSVHPPSLWRHGHLLH